RWLARYRMTRSWSVSSAVESPVSRQCQIPSQSASDWQVRCMCDIVRGGLTKNSELAGLLHQQSKRPELFVMFGRAGSVSDGQRCPSLTLPARPETRYTNTGTRLRS